MLSTACCKFFSTICYNVMLHPSKTVVNNHCSRSTIIVQSLLTTINELVSSTTVGSCSNNIVTTIVLCQHRTTIDRAILINIVNSKSVVEPWWQCCSGVVQRPDQFCAWRQIIHSTEQVSRASVFWRYQACVKIVSQKLFCYLPGNSDTDALEYFTESLSKFTRFSGFRPLATLSYASEVHNGSSIVSR